MLNCKYVRLNEYGRMGWPKESEYIGEVIGGDDFTTRVKWYDHNRVFVHIIDIVDHILEDTTQAATQ